MVGLQNGPSAAALALKTNVDEDHDLSAPEHATLAEAQADHRVRHIKDLLNTDEWCDLIPDPVTALAMWFEQVHSGAERGHKPILEEKLNLESRKEFESKVFGQDREVSYDVWSNMHCAYVGMAAGIGPDTLIRCPPSPNPVSVAMTEATRSPCVREWNFTRSTVRI